MLKTNFENYLKGSRFISLLEEFLGRGIFKSDGETWRAQRKTVSYEFNTRSLRNFIMETAAVELHTRFISALEKATEMNRIVDLQELLERYSFDNICKVAFNVDPGCLSGDGTSGSEFMKAFDEVVTLISGRFMYVIPGFHKVKKLFNFGFERRLQKLIATVHKFTDDIIKSRMDAKDKKIEEDLLLEENSEGNMVYRPDNSFKYPVFRGGLRICLGREMAYTQMKLVAATIIEMFEVEVVATTTEKSPSEHVLSLTMRMKEGLK
nr:cytochrome P450 94A1-like [Tanacetum cinerariifolium]